VGALSGPHALEDEFEADDERKTKLSGRLLHIQPIIIGRKAPKFLKYSTSKFKNAS
jgi:hypothetical protein